MVLLPAEWSEPGVPLEGSFTLGTGRGGSGQTSPRRGGHEGGVRAFRVAVSVETGSRRWEDECHQSRGVPVPAVPNLAPETFLTSRDTDSGDTTPVMSVCVLIVPVGVSSV